MECVLRAMGEEGAAGCWSSFPEAAMLALTSDESLSRVSVWLPLRAPVCQQCRMLLPLAPRAQGAMKSSFGDDKRLARGGRGALVVERWLIRCY